MTRVGQQRGKKERKKERKKEKKRKVNHTNFQQDFLTHLNFMVHKHILLYANNNTCHYALFSK
jgi:hypothetical protein